MNLGAVRIGLRALTGRLAHNYPRYAFFLKLYFKDIGVDLEGRVCPFCGKRFSSNKEMLAHLRKWSTCRSKLEKLVAEAYNIYKPLSEIVYTKYKQGWTKTYCAICGFSRRDWRVVLEHAYREHIQPLILPIPYKRNIENTAQTNIPQIKKEKR